jgi:hypothetical protein
MDSASMVVRSTFDCSNCHWNAINYRPVECQTGEHEFETGNGREVADLGSQGN